VPSQGILPHPKKLRKEGEGHQQGHDVKENGGK